MKKYLPLIILILAFCPIAFAGESLGIVKRGKQPVTFDSLEVSSNSIKTQFIVIKSRVNNVFTNVTGFAKIAGSSGQYKRQLPITSTFDNPSHHFTVSIAYSESDKGIICLKECWNTSNESYEFPELQFDLEWYLLKNKSF